jgi:hypothetical protein
MDDKLIKRPKSPDHGQKPCAPAVDLMRKYDWEHILGPEKYKPDLQLNVPPIFLACIDYLEQRGTTQFPFL